MAFFLAGQGLWRHCGLSLLNLLLSFAVPVVWYI